jgi:hypothetical protein
VVEGSSCMVGGVASQRLVPDRAPRAKIGGLARIAVGSVAKGVSTHPPGA